MAESQEVRWARPMAAAYILVAVVGLNMGAREEANNQIFATVLSFVAWGVATFGLRVAIPPVHHAFWWAGAGWVLAVLVCWVESLVVHGPEINPRAAHGGLGMQLGVIFRTMMVKPSVPVTNTDTNTDTKTDTKTGVPNVQEP